MSARLLLLTGAVAVLAGCNQSGETNANQAATSANSAASTVKHPTYCFFKDADTKGWSTSRDSQGSVTVTGKAHVDDSRYAAQLGQSEIAGSSANVWLTMGPNSGAYGAPDNWWDVTASIAGSAAVETVKVMCGKKTVAELKVPPAG
jgi:hypothetical protein